MAPNKISVLIVDDHELVRRGLTVSIRTFNDLQLLGEADGGKEAIRQCERLQPDVVLLDLKLPDISGIDVIPQIRIVSPDTAIVALTTFKDDTLVHRAMQAGAMSYLLKNVSIDELSQAIRQANRGRPTLSPEAAQALMDRAYTDALGRPQLTDREMEVLHLMVKGLSNPQIGEALTISRSTVKNHVSSILGKLGASSRTQAVSLAIQLGLIDDTDKSPI